MADGESGGDGQQHVVLSNVFVICGKRCRVTLTKTRISWEDEHWAKQKECVSLCEVVAAEPKEVKPKECLRFFRSKWSKKATITELNHQANCLQVHCVDRIWKHRWRLRTLSFWTADYRIAQLWTSSIRDLLKGFHNRPHRLLIFINPFGGKRKSPQIYERKVQPLLKLAQVDAHVIVTERPNHAKEYLLNSCNAFGRYDGIICVGGDGMFNELLNGLLIRTQHDLGVDPNNPNAMLLQPKIRIGVIPGGSTDAVAFTTSGTNDPVTATLHIILGDSLGLDVSSIHSDSRLLSYCTTMLAYGYFGDTLVESEKYRWMGPKRYDFSGVKKFLQLKSYEGEVMFHCDPKSESSPVDQLLCCTGCGICSQAPDLIQAYNSVSSDSKAWRVIRGKFVAINNATTTCACSRAKKGISPSAHVGDGCTDLILVKKCSRFSYLRYLIATAQQHTSPFGLNFVKVFRVREFQFRPFVTEDKVGDYNADSSVQHFSIPPSRNSVWNCDGEILREPTVSVKAHCQLVNIFARGKEAGELNLRNQNDDFHSVTVTF